MPRVFAVGETVLDIIFENDIPISACVGGSMLNSAISLGRMHVPVSMITGYSQDQAGRMADSFLIKNGVDISYITNYSDGKTTIALAFLDAEKKATYQFYQDRPANENQLKLPEFAHGDLLLFGSVFSLRAPMRLYFSELLKSARESGVCSIYDPNFREAHLNDLEAFKPAILSNMSYASIVRGSDEDFKHIFGLTDPETVYEIVKIYCKNLIITRGSESILLFTAGFTKSYSIPAIDVVSTIGAGDSFNAGLLKAMFHQGTDNKTLQKLNERGWDELINNGIACASSVCRSVENYIPVDFAAKLSSY
jgi:fructokinase